MKGKANLSIKDRLTIHIKKTRPTKWTVGVLVSVVLLAALIIIGRFGNIAPKEAPTELSPVECKFRATFSGDIEISDSIRKMSNKIGYDHLLDGVAEYWKASDYVVVNVSGPVLKFDVDNYTSTRDVGEDSVYVRPAALRGLKKSGVDLLGFANDDAYNYGRTGIRSTVETVLENELQYAGVALTDTEPVYVTKTYSVQKEDGTVETRAMAVICINDDIVKKSTVGAEKAGVINSSMGNIYEKVYEASTLTDHVVAYVHFDEREGQAVSEDQLFVAQSLIDAGADVVIGNSRELQKMEIYNGGLIAYGLGSIISDDIYSTSKDACLLDLVVTTENELKVYLTPVHLTQGRPEITDNKFYKKRISSVLTNKLDKDSYHILDNGIIEITIGTLEAPVYVEPTAEPTVQPTAEDVVPVE